MTYHTESAFIPRWACRCTTAVLLVCTSSIAAADTSPPAARLERSVIIAGGDRNFPPSTFMEDGEPKGFQIDMLRAAANAVGLKVVFELENWQESTRRLERGEIDVIAGMSYSLERDKRFDFTVQYATNAFGLLVRRNSGIAELEDTKGMTIGIQSQGVMQNFVRENHLDINEKILPNVPALLRCVSDGGCDGALVSKKTTLYTAAKLGIKDVRFTGKDVAVKRTAFAVREGDVNLVQLLNEGLAIINASGEMQAIKDKWFGSSDNSELYRTLKTWTVRVASIVGAIVVFVLMWNWRLRREIAERKKFEEALENTRAELEQRVRDRTAELAEINEMLKDEIVRQRRAEAERKQLESQLRHAQKMETIGTLAGGIAHDFNNMLTPIVGYSDMLLDEVSEHSSAYTKVQKIKVHARHATNLVRQILSFSRQSEQEQRPTDLARVIDEALHFIRATMPKTIEFQQRIAPYYPIINGDPTQIHQLVMNLCINAAQAMEEGGGVLEVRLDGFDVDYDFARRYPRLSPGRHARVTVSDSGHGMTPSIRERMFEPFFTTKSQGKGTGLGLTTVHAIIKSHDGEVTVYSEPDKGTTVAVYLPAVGGAIASEDERIGIGAGGSERILFVDDEVDNAVMVAEMLEKLGYTVTTFIDSQTALREFESRPCDFDLVITDQTMPGMTGDSLAREMLRVRHDIPIIMITGFSPQMTPESTRALGVRELLMKPLLGADLDAAIRRAVEQPVSLSA